MNKDRVMKIKSYTVELVEHVGEQAIPYHITAGELLELLNQVEEGERAIAKLNAIEADETYDKDYGDLYDVFSVKDQVLGGEAGKRKAGA